MEAKILRFGYENKYRRLGFDLIIGADEAGRGPLAGPVAAAAVAVRNLKNRDSAMSYLFGAVKDSKKISERRREEIYEKIVTAKNLIWGCAMVSARVIDKVNIFEASKIAMVKAIADLETRAGYCLDVSRVYCLVDGNFSVDVPYAQQSVIAGDAKVFSISAASIIAKVTRDRYMIRLEKKYPGYGFARHKGYPTRHHIEALSRLGLCPAHRLSFKPCATEIKKVIIN